jgi:light-regulated signal transduction histidine kinase (bacteriophytochrome)
MQPSPGPLSSEARAAAAEAELQAFSYNVSHDLASSFRLVSQFSRLLMREIGGELTDRQRSHAEHLRAATERGDRMMDQLQQFSRAQQQTLEPVRHDATLAMRRAMMGVEIADPGERSVTVEPLGEVFADCGLIALVFHHLLDNAQKFHGPGAPIRIVVDAHHDATFWRVRVRDHGIGVEPAHRAQAFGMFRRLNADTAYPGVGAGLAICRRIARRHGGDLEFLDCPEGACIELALPQAPPLQ